VCAEKCPFSALDLVKSDKDGDEED
jgi:hypothetical protein